MAQKFSISRSFAAVMQPVATFIIHSVWQNCSIRGIKLLKKNMNKKFQQGNFLHAPFISALFVIKEKTRRFRSCSLLYVDVVLHHTTGSAYQGNPETLYLFYFYFKHILSEFSMLNSTLISFCSYQRDCI